MILNNKVYLMHLRSIVYNSIVIAIRNGNKELEKEWKLFFLKEEVKADQKADEPKKVDLNRLKAICKN